MKCKVEACERKVEIKGWCRKHYQTNYKNHPTYKRLSEANKRKHPGVKSPRGFL